MSFEISEQDGDQDDNVLSGVGDEYNNFVEEFLDKVSIKTIMSGSRSIGRNEARLMLAQFRECNIEIVTFDDPGVLMLDGLAISELEEFLESGGESLEMAIRGPQPDDLVLTTDQYNTTNKKQYTTLTQLRSILEKFRKTTNTNDKDIHRKEFFLSYGGLSNASKQSIQPQIRSQIENAVILDAAHQETLLMTIVLPTIDEEEKEMVFQRRLTGNNNNNNEGTEGYTSTNGGGGIGTTGTASFGGTTSFGERYRTASNVGTLNVEMQSMYNDIRSRVVSTQSKNLREWLFSNLTSQHVWFFISGFVLFWIFFIQTWVDYAYGAMWRALLMELLCLASLLICMMEADTQFIRMQIQERLYNYYQFLSTIKGRTYFYTFLCFCAFGRFSIYDIMAVFGGIILLLLTLTRFLLYQWSETCIDDFVVLLHDSSLIRYIIYIYLFFL